MLTYTRTVDDPRDGVRGTIVSGPMSMPTVERGPPFKWLRPMVYRCVFAPITFSSGAQARAIRILGSYSNDRIYIHPIPHLDPGPIRPEHLKGCITPGLRGEKPGVLYSALAMGTIFDALGGYVEGDFLELRVIGEAS